MLLLFRIAYLHTMIIYAACASLGFPGSYIGLAATAILAVGAEVELIRTRREEPRDEKEMRHMV